MYVWIGCKLPESFETEIRSLCLEGNKTLGLDTVVGIHGDLTGTNGVGLDTVIHMYIFFLQK